MSQRSGCGDEVTSPYSFRGRAGPITSIDKLGQVLQLSPAFLLDVAARPVAELYRPAQAPHKRDGRPREVYSPSRDLRKIQHRLVDRFFRKPAVVCWPHYVFGGIHKTALREGDSRDHVACARVHCGAKRVLKLDIEDFFGNVTSDLVFEVFNDLLGWSISAAELATKLCIREGRLPQGGITSSYIALASLFDVEPRLVRLLEQKRLTYTRYVDDITISSKSFHQDFSSITRMIEQRLMEKGFVINSAKVDDLSVGLQALSVHGLNIAFQTPILPRNEVRRIKSVCRQTKMDAKEAGRRTLAFRRRYYRAMGLVNKLSRVGSISHKKHVASLRSVKPLPSFSDYEISTNVGLVLQKRFADSNEKFWYWKTYNRLMARLDLIGAENKRWASTLRRYMRNHYKPNFSK